jgi:hypothetical protein
MVTLPSCAVLSAFPLSSWGPFPIYTSPRGGLCRESSPWASHRPSSDLIGTACVALLQALLGSLPGKWWGSAQPSAGWPEGPLAKGVAAVTLLELKALSPLTAFFRHQVQGDAKQWGPRASYFLCRMPACPSSWCPKKRHWKTLFSLEKSRQYRLPMSPAPTVLSLLPSHCSPRVVHVSQSINLGWHTIVTHPWSALGCTLGVICSVSLDKNVTYPPWQCHTEWSHCLENSLCSIWLSPAHPNPYHFTAVPFLTCQEAGTTVCNVGFFHLVMYILLSPCLFFFEAGSC